MDMDRFRKDLAAEDSDEDEVQIFPDKNTNGK
jgi:hypothetical protein